MRLLWGTVPALAILAFFAGVANWVPQVGWEPVRVEALSPDTSPTELATIGEELVGARGCLVCHVIQPGVDRTAPPRAPNWYGIGEWASVDYLVESLYDPGAELVEGYTNIMPAVTGPPASLTYEELVAVINYLQSLGGAPRVRIGDIPRVEEFGQGARIEEPTAGQDPQATLVTYGCLGCHSLGGEGGEVGPPLDRAEIEAEAERRDLSLEEYIRESILDPWAYVVGGFEKVMPPGFDERIPPEELEALIQYLVALERR